MKLYYSPVSSYSQKALIAFYEKDVAFTPEIVNLMDPAARAAFQKVNRLDKVPFLLDEGRDWRIPESTIIIEYLEDHYPTQGTKLIPDDRHAARKVRFRDRLWDLYVNEPMQTIFFDGMKAPAEREPKRVERAKHTLETTLSLMDDSFAKWGPWAAGEHFSMADCAAAPCLGYLRMVHPFDAYKNVTAYANRIMERPSVARVMKEAAPYLEKMKGH